MKPTRLEIPEFQNWDCHACGDCCRGQMLIRISRAEKDRLHQQGWTTADGVNPSVMVITEDGYFRLGHQANGACVFLDVDGRCRIHARFGEGAKPLACRLYPFVLRPAGGKLVVSLRFSCPSAAAGTGRPLAQHSAALNALAREAVSRDSTSEGPPAIGSESGGAWPDFQRFLRWLDASMWPPELPVSLKLSRALFWVHAMEKGRLERITGESSDEVFEALVRNAREKLPELPPNPSPPSRVGRLFLRTLVLDHARKVTVAEMRDSGRHRRHLAGALLRFLCGVGRTPEMQAGFGRVRFSDIEKPFGPPGPEIEVCLTRYFRMKILGLQFCGPAFHGAGLIEGFRNLALLYPVILWLARWHSATAGRNSLSQADVTRAITTADYHHGYSNWVPWRTRLLSQRNDIAKLCNWYSR